MVTKADLETINKQLEERTQKLRQESYDKDIKIRGLEKVQREKDYEIQELKNKVEKLVNHVNIRASVLKNIVNILSGEASVQSKLEVIKDIFREELEEIGKQERGGKRYRTYVSDEVDENNLW